MVAPPGTKGVIDMKTEIRTADLDTRALADAELDTVAGGLAKYYQMGGVWYIVGHDKHGHSTGAVRIG